MCIIPIYFFLGVNRKRCRKVLKQERAEYTRSFVFLFQQTLHLYWCHFFQDLLVTMLGVRKRHWAYKSTVSPSAVVRLLTSSPSV